MGLVSEVSFVDKDLRAKARLYKMYHIATYSNYQKDYSTNYKNMNLFYLRLRRKVSTI